jgi:hypothetical protein
MPPFPLTVIAKKILLATGRGGKRENMVSQFQEIWFFVAIR